MLAEAARWLTELGVTHVAMEATGIYSMPVYHALLEHGTFEKVLVCHAGHVKNVPGRKTDPFTELPEEVPVAGGRMRFRVATVAGHDHTRRCAAGPVAAGGATARVA